MTQAIRPTFINCARCGTEKKVGRGGPIPAYCSAACRNALSNERARKDGRYEQRLVKMRARAAAQREAEARPCPYCGSPMTNPRRVQCGAPECKRQFRNARQAEFQRKHKAEHGVYYSRQYDGDRVKAYRITCIQCGTEAVVTKPTSRYCSHSCWYKASHARHAQVELAWKPLLRAPRLATVILLRPLRRRWFSACCPMCSTWFITDNPRDRNCSRRCSRRAAKDRRRAMERDAFVQHVSRPDVYERDQWTCQLCGEAVLRDEVVPHPQAPTLDHIIALSRGGTHEPANVQLAHFYCNLIKNDGEWADVGRRPAA
ncbi:HNH endonuclease [Streptomyces ortus]|uniref:HNH endonuclease n=1 Tax=Streptomyces ortus TaxID=2867268 RepID=UPI0035583223